MRLGHRSYPCQIQTAAVSRQLRSQARIQDSEGGGGGSYIQKGGGGVRTGISGADPNWCRALGKSRSKKKLQTAVGGGGGPITPQKTPVSAHGSTFFSVHLAAHLLYFCISYSVSPILLELISHPHSFYHDL